MNFDLSWFATVPGMFITGGVILLIIALVMLIVNGKKTQTAQVASSDNSNFANQQAPVPVMQAPTNVDMANNMVMPEPVMPTMPVEETVVPTIGQGFNNEAVVVNEPVVQSQPEIVQPVNDTLSSTPTIEPVPVISQVEPPVDTVVNEPVALETTPVSESATIEPVQPIVETSAPTIPVIEEQPIVEQAVVEQPEVNVLPTEGVVDTTPVIYGGANPVVTDINISQDATHQIYGGADPLQNTGPIPQVEQPAVNPVEQSMPLPTEQVVVEPVITNI